MFDRSGLFACIGSAVFGSSIATAQLATATDSRLKPIRIDAKDIVPFHITTLGNFIDVPGFEPNPDLTPTLRACQITSSHTDADFAGGSYILQAGMGEGELFAATYTLNPSDFPIKFESAEVIFGVSSASVSTTTQWSLLIYEGTPATGNLVAEFNSDGLILPHLVLPPGTAGVNLQLTVDPGDPEQIFLTDDGSSSFSIAIRIDVHNNQTADPCFVGPPTGSNAFMATDLSGLSAPTQNWLFGLNCGPLGCPPNGGWSTFGGLNVLCRPSGDWVARATWSSTSCTPGVGACCLSDGTCLDSTLQSDCTVLGGTFQGDSSTCATVTCVEEPGPCCFEATGNCIQLPASQCLGAGGIVSGTPGDDCPLVCFPVGAVCFPDGTCQDGLTPDDATAMGGIFQGHGTDCATTVCPQPTGACCFDNGFCIELTEADCIAAAATWMGFGTDCTDADQNGTADVCETAACSEADVTTTGAGIGDPGFGVPDGQITGADLQYFVNGWVANDLTIADVTTTGAGIGDPGFGVPDGQITGADLQYYVNIWLLGCP